VSKTWYSIWGLPFGEKLGDRENWMTKTAGTVQPTNCATDELCSQQKDPLRVQEVSASAERQPAR
jgi:hypothetical protein